MNSSGNWNIGGMAIAWRGRMTMMALLIPVLLAGCRTEDVRIQVIKVPQLKNAECAQIIEKALRSAEGVVNGTDAIVFDYTRQTVTVRYDSMKLALKNLESIVAEAGFDANNTPAEPNARSSLPAACRGESVSVWAAPQPSSGSGAPLPSPAAESIAPQATVTNQ